MHVTARSALVALPRILALTLLAATTAAATEITVKRLSRDQAIVEIDGTRRLLRVDDTSPEGVTLISADDKEAVLEVDGEEKRYGLGDPSRGIYEKPDAVTVRIWPTPNRMYAVLGSINGRPVDFVVDTGANLVALSGRQAQRLGIDVRVVGTPSQTITASGVAAAHLVNLSRVKVGDIELRGVEGIVIDGDYPPITLLGMSFLNRLNMRKDGQVMELQTK